MGVFDTYRYLATMRIVRTRTVLLALLATPCASAFVDTANWMGMLKPILGNATLLDLSMPGAHDAMTYGALHMRPYMATHAASHARIPWIRKGLRTANAFGPYN